MLTESAYAAGVQMINGQQAGNVGANLSVNVYNASIERAKYPLIPVACGNTKIVFSYRVTAGMLGVAWVFGKTGYRIACCCNSSGDVTALLMF